MARNPILLPNPQQLNLSHGTFKLADIRFIKLECEYPQSILFSAIQIQKSLLSLLNIKIEIYVGSVIDDEPIGIILRLTPVKINNPQGYSIHISPSKIVIESRNPQGLYYGACTLIQILQYYLANIDNNFEHTPIAIPCMEVEDWPDFKQRGVMLDISRDKVPTLETLTNLIDLLASWKINQLQLYMEHTFAYQKHPDVWVNASPFTGEEILLLDAYCRERFIELVPNQNSFSHLERWLMHSRYKHLAEAPNNFNFAWEHHSRPFSLCPIDPGSIKLISSMYDELLPHFSSRQINVGCDETFDLGQGRSKDLCQKIGTGRVYLDFVLKIYEEVKQRGFTMQLWGDMLFTHPDLISDLPEDCIVLEWGYEGNHPFNSHSELLASSELPFYVCPGTSSWNSVAGRTENCLDNLANAAINGKIHGALGYLITDWGDNGHWQVLPISYLGFAAGSAFSWSFETNRDLDIKAVLNRYAFLDRSNHMGGIAYRFGNLYQNTGIKLDNSSALFEILQRPIHRWKDCFSSELLSKNLEKASDIIDQEETAISNTDSLRPDRELLEREFSLTRNLLLHACKRGLFSFGFNSISKDFLLLDLKKIIAEYEEIWLNRNRPGGLLDSLSYFNTALDEYK